MWTFVSALVHHCGYFSICVIGGVTALFIAVLIHRTVKWFQEEGQHNMGDVSKAIKLSETEEASLIRASQDDTDDIDQERDLQEELEVKSRIQLEETSCEVGDRSFEKKESADIPEKLQEKEEGELNSQVGETGDKIRDSKTEETSLIQASQEDIDDVDQECDLQEEPGVKSKIQLEETSCAVSDRSFEDKDSADISEKFQEKEERELNSQAEQTGDKIGHKDFVNEASVDNSEELQGKQKGQLKRRSGGSSRRVEDTGFEKSEQLQESSKATHTMGPFVSKGNSSKKQRKKQSLEDFGYQFNEDGELRKIDSGAPFEFNVIPGDHHYNQAHYEELGKVVDDYVYCLLEAEGLIRVTIPINTSANKPTGFFFMSEDAVNQDRLLVLIHGSGVVRAGQWARRLIINNNLQCGTQLPFIRKAMEDGYGVVVMNTNLNSDEDYQVIKGSSTPEEHGYYVWNNFILKGQCRHIAIVAHSYGGVVVGSLANEFNRDFLDRVFAVAFTDSFGYQFGTKSPLYALFKRVSVNWVSSDRPLDEPVGGYGRDFQMRSAGVTKHEWTSWSSFPSIFKFFDERYGIVTKLTAGKQQGAQSHADLHSDQSRKKMSDQNEHARGDHPDQTRSVHSKQVQSSQSEDAPGDQEKKTQIEAEYAHNDQPEVTQSDQREQAKDVQHEPAPIVLYERVESESGQHKQTVTEQEPTFSDNFDPAHSGKEMETPSGQHEQAQSGQSTETQMDWN